MLDPMPAGYFSNDPFLHSQTNAGERTPFTVSDILRDGSDQTPCKSAPFDLDGISSGAAKMSPLPHPAQSATTSYADYSAYHHSADLISHGYLPHHHHHHYTTPPNASYEYPANPHHMHAAAAAAMHYSQHTLHPQPQSQHHHLTTTSTATIHYGQPLPYEQMPQHFASDSALTHPKSLDRKHDHDHCPPVQSMYGEHVTPNYAGFGLPNSMPSVPEIPTLAYHHSQHQYAHPSPPRSSEASPALHYDAAAPGELTIDSTIGSSQQQQQPQTWDALAATSTTATAAQTFGSSMMMLTPQPTAAINCDVQYRDLDQSPAAAAVGQLQSVASSKYFVMYYIICTNKSDKQHNYGISFNLFNSRLCFAQRTLQQSNSAPATGNLIVVIVVLIVVPLFNHIDRLRLRQRTSQIGQTARQTQATHPVLPDAGARSGTSIPTATLPVRTGARNRRLRTGTVCDTGEDLVPESTLQIEAHADRGHAGDRRWVPGHRVETVAGVVDKIHSQQTDQD